MAGISEAKFWMLLKGVPVGVNSWLYRRRDVREGKVVHIQVSHRIDSTIEAKEIAECDSGVRGCL